MTTSSSSIDTNPFGISLRPVTTQHRGSSTSRSSPEKPWPSVLRSHSASPPRDRINIHDAAAQELARRRAALKQVTKLPKLPASTIPPKRMTLVKGRTPYARHVSPTPTFHIVLKTAAVTSTTATTVKNSTTPSSEQATNSDADTGEEEKEEGQYYFDLDYQFQSSSPPPTHDAQNPAVVGSSSGDDSFGTRLKPLPSSSSSQVLQQQQQQQQQQQALPQTRTYQIDLNQKPDSTPLNTDNNETAGNSHWIPSGLIQKGPRSILELRLKPDRIKPVLSVEENDEESPEDDNTDDDNNTTNNNPPPEIELQMRHVALIPCRAGGPMRRKITSQTSVSIPLLLHPSKDDKTTTTSKHPVLLQVQLGQLQRIDVDHSQFQIQMTYMDPETQQPILDKEVVSEQTLVVEWKHVVDVLPTIAEDEDHNHDDQDSMKADNDIDVEHDLKQHVDNVFNKVSKDDGKEDEDQDDNKEEEGKDESDKSTSDSDKLPPPLLLLPYAAVTAAKPVPRGAPMDKDKAPRMPARRRVVESSQHRDLDTPDPASLIKVDKMPSRPRRRGSDSEESMSTTDADTGTTADFTADAGADRSINNIPATTTTMETKMRRNSSSNNDNMQQRRRKKKRRYRIKSLKLRHLPTIVEEERDTDEEWFTASNGSCANSVCSNSDGEVDHHNQQNNQTAEENERNTLQSESSPALAVVDDSSTCNARDVSTTAQCYPESEDFSDATSKAITEEPTEVTLALSEDDDEGEPVEANQQQKEKQNEKQEEVQLPSKEEVTETMPEPSKRTEPTRKGHHNTLTKEKGRSLLMWYARMGNPSKDVMKRKILKLPPELRDFTVEDVEGLPWVCRGAMLDVKAMNELFVSGE